MNTVFTSEQISKILPHRYPFLLVDRVVEFEAGKRAVGKLIRFPSAIYLQLIYCSISIDSFSFTSLYLFFFYTLNK